MSIIIGGERMSQFYCRENELTALSKGKCIHLKSWIIQVKYCLWE